MRNVLRRLFGVNRLVAGLLRVAQIGAPLQWHPSRGFEPRAPRSVPQWHRRIRAQRLREAR